MHTITTPKKEIATHSHVTMFRNVWLKLPPNFGIRTV